ncbi:MAG: hypothetical protein ACPG5B_02195 [Chitinophagales bacterium]
MSNKKTTIVILVNGKALTELAKNIETDAHIIALAKAKQAFDTTIKTAIGDISEKGNYFGKTKLTTEGQSLAFELYHSINNEQNGHDNYIQKVEYIANRKAMARKRAAKKRTKKQPKKDTANATQTTITQHDFEMWQTVEGVENYFQNLPKPVKTEVFKKYQIEASQAADDWAKQLLEAAKKDFEKQQNK